MNTTIEPKSLCRVCLEEGADVSLFEDDEDMKLYLKVMACSTVQITESDGYPSYICPLCYSMLDTAYKFKVRCEDSDVKLRTCITKHHVKLEFNDANSDIMDADFNLDDEQDYDNFFKVTVKEECLDEKPIETVLLKKEITKGKSKKKKSKWKIEKPDDSHTEEETKASIQSNKKKKRTLMRGKNIKRIVSSKIASSLLEGQCVWSGFSWSFVSQPVDTQEEIKAKKEADKIRKIIEEDKTNQTRKKLKEMEKKLKVRVLKKVILCDTCGKVLKTRHQLRHHKLSHQEKSLVNNFKCPHTNCSKSFKAPDYVTRHYKRCHGERKDFVCNDCGKQFAFLSQLRKHMKGHAGVVNWKCCPHCSQKYKTQKSVDIHIKSVHTGERPYVCTMCDSAFFHTDYLKEHMRLHTGETPFKCPICKRGYAQRGNMKSHMKQHRISELDDHLKATLKPNYLKLLKDC